MTNNTEINQRSLSYLVHGWFS